MSRMSPVPWVFAVGMLLAGGTALAAPVPAFAAVQPVLDAEHDAHDDTAPADAGHTDHEVPAPSPDHTGHTDHPAPADTATATDHTTHGSEPDSVPPATKRNVLAGFAVVNASVLTGAFVIRRRDRRTR